MIKQGIVAAIFGLIGMLYYLQYDHWFRSVVAQRVCQELSTNLSCRIAKSAVTDLNIVAGSITLKELLVLPSVAAPWRWQAGSLSLTFSWWELLLYGTLDLHIRVTDLIMESLCDDAAAIEPHLRAMFSADGLSQPIILKQLELQNARFFLYDKNNQQRFLLRYSAQLKKINNAIKAVVRINDGESAYDERLLFKKAYGTIELNASSIETQPSVVVGGSCSLQIPYLDAHSMYCHIGGNWHGSQGVFSIKNNDHSFDITARVHDPDISIAARIPVSGIWRWIYNTVDDGRLTGTCQLSAKGNLQEDRFKGSLLFKELAGSGVPIGSLGRITFDKCGNTWKGSLYGQRKSGIACSGTWRFNQAARDGAVRLVNDTALSLSPSSLWSIPAHATEVSGSFDTSGNIHGKFRCCVHHAKLNSTIATAGTLHANQEKCAVTGHIGDNSYSMQVNLCPYMQIVSCFYADAHKKPLIDLHSTKVSPHELAGTVNFGCIREALNVICAYDLQGEGLFDTRIHCAADCLDISLKLTDGTIRLPQTYNFINGFSAHLVCDWARHILTINELDCSLHRGHLSSKRAVLHYTEDGSLLFAYMPLLFQDCLLNIQKDLFTIVSGRLLFNKSLYNIPALQGVVMLDRSQLNENLFSYAAQQSLVRNAKSMVGFPALDLGLDISLFSAHPIRVKTPFLETDAQLQLAVSHTLNNPALTGQVTLHSGELSFPYKPLYITKGNIYFMPNQLYDPMIELEARNTIKKCNIGMHVTGSLRNHHISLSSSPPLTEEQIVALLLVGSQEESLNIVMPAIIMQNIKQLLFGSEQTRSRIERYFTGFLKPFKHITLVPSFVDQTGRGGLRGAVEINVHDRLRALIQKNFSLTEDTRFEVEYMLSDDISLRGVRDERRDISGELEMRWKF